MHEKFLSTRTNFNFALDINECNNELTCQHGCTNLAGSYTCSCPKGYRLNIDGRTCEDIDECKEQNFKCGKGKVSGKPSFTANRDYGKHRSTAKPVVICETVPTISLVYLLGRMCFNRLGDFTCIDTPCPVSFKRNEKNGFCVKQCPPGSNCSSRPISAIEYKTIGTCCTQLAHTHCIQLFQRAFKLGRI